MMHEEFGSFVSEICAHSSPAGGRPLLWTIIANPSAGGFTIRSRWKKHHADLTECVKKAIRNPLREKCGPSKTALEKGNANTGLIQTTARGHAKEITEALIKEAIETAAAIKKADDRPFYLVITAGGDGTSLEVLTGLYHAPEDIRRDFVILRLPMGTGNDGSDARELGKALDLIIEPSVITRQKAIRLVTASGKGPFLAFNILSVGIDAFVTHMTNKMKGQMPGDSYMLWVDIAALFYDRVYKVGFMDVRSTDEQGKEVMAFREKLLLLAVGESGHRTYGSNKRILPDDRNVCAVKQTSLFRKLTLKGLFLQGKHINKSEAILWNANRAEFTSQHPILAQMDGETVLLEESDFPAAIELTEPIIPILKAAVNTSP